MNLKLKVRSAIILLGVVLAAGIALAVGIGAFVFYKTTIGGPAYARIIDSKDLLADILPPPEYVIEAYLEATLAMNGERDVPTMREKMQALHKDYNDRLDVWKKAALPGDLTDKLTVKSDATVQKFWNAVEGALIPALTKSDKAAAASAYRDVTAAYRDHRAIIDDIVKDANTFSTNAEAEARSTITTMEIIMCSAIAVLLALLGIGITMINRGVVAPILKITDVLADISDNRTGVAVPYTGRHDEIGIMAKATERLRISLIDNARMQADQAERDRRAVEEKAEYERMTTAERVAADKRAAAERDAAQHALLEEFDATVGTVLKATIEGDFSRRVSLEDKNGVIHNLAANLNTMCENVGAALDDISRMMIAMSNGDLTQRITANYHGAFASLKDSINKTGDQLALIVSDINTAVTEVTNASTEVSAATSDLSQRTEEQAAGLEETSASMEQMAATVKKNAENAQHANDLAANTRKAAEQGGEVAISAVKAMARIEESSGKIADIIGVIDEIARQTNLLALNAAVEAARAGDAGRGFAVVASEVRSLAQRSSQAAKDIKDLITNSNTQVKDGVDLVNRAGTSLNDILASMTSVADIVSDIATASAEQATGVEQVNRALGKMDETTQQNSALVEENAATAKTLEQQATAMQQLVAFFKVGDGAAANQPSRLGSHQPLKAAS